MGGIREAWGLRDDAFRSVGGMATTQKEKYCDGRDKKSGNTDVLAGLLLPPSLSVAGLFAEIPYALIHTICTGDCGR